MVFLLVLVFLLRALCSGRDNNACHIDSRTSLAIGVVIESDALHFTTLALIAFSL